MDRMQRSFCFGKEGRGMTKKIILAGLVLCLWMLCGCAISEGKTGEAGRTHGEEVEFSQGGEGKTDSRSAKGNAEVADDTQNGQESAESGDDFQNAQGGKRGAEGNPDGEEEGDLVIGLTDTYNLVFPFWEVQGLYGQEIETYEAPEGAGYGFNEVLVEKLVRGDEDVDIYFISMGNAYCEKLMEDGICYPLDESMSLKAEQEAFFDSISDFFRTESGRIWGMPIKCSAEVLLAYPENMKKYEVTQEDIGDYFSLLKMLERVKNDQERHCFLQGSFYGEDLLIGYVANHGKERKLGEEFREYLQTMWTGWTMYGFHEDENLHENHPLMGAAYMKNPAYVDMSFQELIEKNLWNELQLSVYENAFLMDPEETIFNMTYSREILEREALQEGTRAYPLPLLSKNDRKLLYVGGVAVINPRGKHREKALQYLETLSAYLREHGNLGFVYQDQKAYEGIFDMDSELMQDLYGIYQDSMVRRPDIADDVFNEDIYPYHQGKKSLDEAMDSIQEKIRAFYGED